MSVVVLLMLPTVMANGVTRNYPASVDAGKYTGALSVYVYCGGVNSVSRGPVYHEGSASIDVKAVNGEEIKESHSISFWGAKQYGEVKVGSHLYIKVWSAEKFNSDGTLNYASTTEFVDSSYVSGDTMWFYNGDTWVSYIRITASSDIPGGGHII